MPAATGTDFAFLLLARVSTGRVKQIEQDSKMFKTKQLRYFCMLWTQSLSVNLSASDMHLAGAAS
jgi:hypothetical protein